jgi:glutamine synthetase
MIATSAAARLLARRTFPAATSTFRCISLEAYEEYGKNVFTGSIANEYLEKHGASGAILKNPAWVKTHSDVVAKAVFDWYVRNSNGLSIRLAHSTQRKIFQTS